MILIDLHIHDYEDDIVNEQDKILSAVYNMINEHLYAKPILMRIGIIFLSKHILLRISAVV